MEITFKSKGNFFSIVLSWIVFSAITYVIFMAFHFAIYFIFYSGKISLGEHFSPVWITALFYSLILPLTIVNNQKARQMIIKHDGEVDPERIKDFFLINQYSLVEDSPGKYRFESRKWFDRLFSGSRNVTIEYTDNEVIIVMPANKVYHVHHGFRFGKIFLRDS
ncbi:MAG TPA: hypothetical protein PKL52_05830 [Tenuifilaceae bacterium]|nr:hypothetical protein [Tenuifilaceae bacterium]